MSGLHVAVVIVAFRNPNDIRTCLGALAASEYRDFEVVICENGGAAAFEALRKETPSELPGGQPVKLILASHNLGYAGGVNLGIDSAPRAGAWWVLNPDTHPDPGALSALVARLEAGDCEAVGCTVQLPNGLVQSHGGRWSKWMARGTSIGHSTDPSRRPDRVQIERSQNYLNGACMLVGRRFFDVVGPMREEYFLYCEEVEWCLRGMESGMRLGYAPDASMLHYQGTTTGNPPDIRARGKTPVYLNERNRLLLTRDLYPAALPVVVFTSLLVIMLRFPRRRAWKQFGYALAGWWAGLKDERGRPSWVGP